MKKLTGKRIGTLILGMLLSIALIGTLAGCGSSNTKEKAEPQQTVAQNGKVSKENPIVVDKDAKTVKIYTEVNGKYFEEATRHGIVYEDGSNGSKSILKSWANQNDFYNALVEIGAQPGNNLSPETAGKSVEGSALDVSVTWEGAGKDIPFEQIFSDSLNKKADFRFGGNQERAKSKNTGCILCLDSCPVGITSNAAHPQKSFDDKKVVFKGVKDVLPADGTAVIVTFKLK